MFSDDSRQYDNNGQTGANPVVVALIAGAALAAAVVLLLASKFGQTWREQTAHSLAEGREKLVSAVESRTPIH